MTPREEELFGILQEESAEVIQAISKRRRFGANERNIPELKQEIGDWLAILLLIEREGYLNLDDVETNIQRKLDKLERNMVHKAPQKEIYHVSGEEGSRAGPTGARGNSGSSVSSEVPV